MQAFVRIAAFVVGLLAITTQWANAQTYPARAVTMIIPFPPGGGNDIVGRYVAGELSKKWGVPVTPENRGGAGGAIGSSAVARSAADGYTMMFISSSYTINAATIAGLTFDPINDLTLVATTGSTDMVVTVAEHVKANSMKELLDLSKQRKILAGTIGGSIEFATLLLMDASKMDMTPVPYKGAGDIFPDMLGGRIDLYVGTASAVLPLVNGKQIRPIATTGKERIKTLPEVPTVYELNLPGAAMDLWWGVFVPSKTPTAIQEKINADVSQIMSTPGAAEFLAKQDARPKSTSLQAGPELVKTEIARWKSLAEKYNIKPN